MLDTMIQPLQGEQETYIVYYHILDGDEYDRTPNHPDFDSSSKSCLHKIAERNYKVITGTNSPVWLTIASYNLSIRGGIS